MPKFRRLRAPSYADNYYQSTADGGYFDPNSFQLNDNHRYSTHETAEALEESKLKHD